MWNYAIKKRKNSDLKERRDILELEVVRKIFSVILFGGIIIATWLHMIRKKPGNEAEWRDCVWKNLISILVLVMAMLSILLIRKVIIFL